MTRGDEARVVAAFCDHLRTEGWAVRTEVSYCDVRAERGGRVLYAEAKGRTAAPGLDVDTMFGQLLRRMPADDDPTVRYAVVVPTEVLRAVLRVPERVRELLRVDVYAVDPGGRVTAV